MKLVGRARPTAHRTLLPLALLLLTTITTLTALHAQVPQLVNYQGRVAVGSTNFNGNGQFKFALVNAAGNTTFWSNDNKHYQHISNAIDQATQFRRQNREYELLIMLAYESDRVISTFSLADEINIK